MIKNKKLIFQIFIYLSIFSLLILFFLWLLQILLLNNYYEYYKTNELNNVLNLIKNNYNSNNFQTILDDVAYNTDFCVEIDSLNEELYNSFQNNKGCIDTNSILEVYTEKIDFMPSPFELLYDKSPLCSIIDKTIYAAVDTATATPPAAIKTHFQLLIMANKLAIKGPANEANEKKTQMVRA